MDYLTFEDKTEMSSGIQHSRPLCLSLSLSFSDSSHLCRVNRWWLDNTLMNLLMLIPFETVNWIRNTSRLGVGLIIRVTLYSVQCDMQYAADQCSAYLLVRLHPNIGVSGTAVHWRSLLPNEVCHLNTPSRVPVRAHKCMHTYVLPTQAQSTPSLKSEWMAQSKKCHQIMCTVDSVIRHSCLSIQSVHLTPFKVKQVM